MEQPTIINEFFDKLQSVTAALPRAAIAQAVDVLFDTWNKGGVVYAIGNGGSASTATHFACDLAKCTIVPDKRRFKTISLCDNMALFSAWTNDSGFGSVFTGQLEAWVQPNDTLVVYSVHGGTDDGDAKPWSENLVKAVKLAKVRGAKIIGLTGFDGGAVAKLSDASIIVPINSEPLGTPLIESLHVVLHHLICTALRQRIESSRT